MGPAGVSSSVPSEWLRRPFPGFSQLSTWFAQIYFFHEKRPIRGLQPYDLWVDSFGKVLTGKLGPKDLELDLCCASLNSIRKSSLGVRIVCAFCGYIFAQSRIAYDDDRPRDEHRFLTSRITLQLVALVCVRRKKPIPGQSEWGCVRWMRAARAASGKHPESLHTLVKSLNNTTWRKLSEMQTEHALALLRKKD